MERAYLPKKAAKVHFSIFPEFLEIIKLLYVKQKMEYSFF